jgi:hypothetical protein
VEKEERNMLSAPKVCFNKDKTVSLSIIMCIPEAGEQCPVSLEPIGYADYIPPFSTERQKKAPNKPLANKRAKLNHTVEHAFSDCPTLACAQMALCGHRFDARALVTHFLCNSLNCPLCRAGHAGSSLSGLQSFPNERWICDMEEAILEEAQREQNNQLHEDILLAAQLQQTMDYLSLPNLILNTLLDHTISASLFFFDSPVNDRTGDFPIHGMQFEMELQPVQMHHRDLPRGISLYSSFSSSSIATPQQDTASTPLVLIRGENYHGGGRSNSGNSSSSSSRTLAEDGVAGDVHPTTTRRNTIAATASSSSNRNSGSHEAAGTTEANTQASIAIIHEGSDLNNTIVDNHFVIMLGNTMYSLNDVSVEYAMSEATLR